MRQKEICSVPIRMPNNLVSTQCNFKRKQGKKEKQLTDIPQKKFFGFTFNSSQKSRQKKQQQN
jgi:hypothetical protein